MKDFSFLLATTCCLLLTTACGSNQSPGVITFSEFSSIHAAKVEENAGTDCAVECQKLRVEFRYVVYVGKQIYAYWEQKKLDTGTDFEALAANIEASITDKTSDTDYFVKLRNWSAAFHDGHVNVIPRDDLSKLEIYSSPVRLQIFEPATVNEKVFVSELKSSEYNVKVGDEVIAVNGVPVKQALDLVEDQSYGSTARMRRARAAPRLVDVWGVENSTSELSITLQRNADVVTVQLPRTIEIYDSEKKAVSPSTGANLIKAMVLPGKIGYLRIDGFSGSQIGTLIDQAMHNLKDTKALIIDLRINGGGDSSANFILARLTSTELVRYQVSANLNPFVMAYRPDLFGLTAIPGTGFAQWSPIKVQPNLTESYVGKPVFALTSSRCFSACDTFVAALKSNKLAVILGEGTGGGTGTPLNFDLPVSKHSFRYSIIRGRTSSGEWIEGLGTLPDVQILPDPEDLASKKDSQLAKVISHVQQSLQPRAESSANLAQQIHNTFGNIWTQGFEKSPTTQEMHHLKILVPHDEL